MKAKEEKGKKKPVTSVRKAGSTSSVNEIPGDTPQDEERIQEEEEDGVDRQRKDSKEEYVQLFFSLFWSFDDLNLVNQRKKILCNYLYLLGLQAKTYPRHMFG